MGLFGGGYEKAGSGIAKDKPKKKGFFRYMEIFGRKFWNLLGLNFLYFLFFLPLLGAGVCLFLWMGGKLTSIAGIGSTVLLAVLFAVLIGPATAAHTKILKNFVMEKPSFVTHDFFQTFRKEFRHSAVVGILDSVVVTCIAAACYVYPQLIDQTGSKVYYVFFGVTLSVGIVLLLMNFYAFLMIVSTNLSLKNTLKNSLALAIVALKQNALTFLIVAAVAAVYVLAIVFVDLKYSMILLFLLPVMPASWVGLVIVFRTYPIIQKYIINPYYEQRGEINPELLQNDPDDEDVLFEDMGGKEKPIEAPKKTKGNRSTSSQSRAAKSHKGKIIS